MPTSTKPNVLFIIADDHRHSAIHARGNPTVQTPTLDRLVEQGTTFTHTYIMGSTSPAVCLPSRGMMLTGRTLWHIDNPPCEGHILWPELLRQEGYATFGTGKWHNQPASFARCFENGAKIFFGGMSDHLAVPVSDFDPSEEYPHEKRYAGEKFSSELFADQAVSFLEKQTGERPFCLYLAFTSPHDPRMAPKEYADLYRPEDIPLPPNFMPEHPFDNGEMRIRDEKLAPFPRTEEVVRQHIGDYYAMISHHDAQMARVLEALEASGQADNTIIVYTADHGLAVGQHGLLGKQNLYDHSMRVPLILSGPGIPQNIRMDARCYLYDVYPTLCELTGHTAPDTVEGRSLAPVIRGESILHRDTIFSAYMDCQRMVRDNRFKLIEYFVEGQRNTQLFDLEEDPHERNDLAEAPEHASRLEQLRIELARWRQEVDDPLEAPAV